MQNKEYIERGALKQKKVYSLERHEYIVPVAEIDWIQAADVVDVVRCKDCANCRYVDAADIYRCDRRGYYSEEVNPSDYCSRGERKEQTWAESH